MSKRSSVIGFLVVGLSWSPSLGKESRESYALLMGTYTGPSHVVFDMKHSAMSAKLQMKDGLSRETCREQA